MSTRPKPQILFVDDEPRVIQGLTPMLRADYEVIGATSSAEALRKVNEIKDLAVVVSDMRMPNMDGATLLYEIMLRRPEVTRILLTGELGRDVAVKAVNKGQIYRFLTKPCPSSELKQAIEAGVLQNRLAHAERAVLQETLIGCIKALMEVLALANPVAFGRAERIKRTAMKCAARLDCEVFWQLEAAALLSQVGYVTVPQAMLEKIHAGLALTAEEQHKLDAVPDVANAMLEAIPRLEPVIQILAALKWNDAALAKLGEGTSGLAARILGTVIEYEAQVALGKTRDAIIAHLQTRTARYGTRVIEAFAASIGSTEAAVASRTVLLREVMPGMTILDELRTETGILLVPKNFEVTTKFLDRISDIAPEQMFTKVRVSVAPEI